MQINTKLDRHNGHDGQPLSAEAIQALLASQSEQSPKPTEQSEIARQPLLKQPYGFGETRDSDIADMIDDLLW